MWCAPLFDRVCYPFDEMPWLAKPIYHPLLRGGRLLPAKFSVPQSLALPPARSASHSAMPDEPELAEFHDYLERLKNFERSGVPQGAGTDSNDGFDLGRMRRVLSRLGDPHRCFKAVHIAGTKGKGSTAAYLSNILREEGHAVGCYTSPHLLSIRERISIGGSGGPIPASILKNLFHRVKKILDQSIQQENGALSHFEVLTALSYLLFAEEKVDIAIIEAGLGGARDATNVICNSELAASVITSIGEEHLAALGGSLESITMAKSGIIKHGCPVIIGGPFEPHIETIIRERASLMKSLVISASGLGVQKTLREYRVEAEIGPVQICDLCIQIKDLNLFIELPDLRLHMFGTHQLQNAATATCAALCLRNKGWAISDSSIRTGLERTRLLGRSQFLSHKESSAVGLSGTTILVDGAHTEASAEGLSEIISITHPEGALAFIVAMASDKDHVAFARQLLKGKRPMVVVLTEVTIAGGRSRSTPASTLKDAWTRVAMDFGIEVLDLGTIGSDNYMEHYGSCSPRSPRRSKVILASCQNSPLIDSIKVADRLLKHQSTDQPALIAITGSLHIVSSLLSEIQS